MKTTIRNLIGVIFALLIGLSQSQAYTLSGVVFGGSAPLAGTNVKLINAADSSSAGSGTTDASGHYSITVGNGTYNLAVSPPAGSGFASAPVNGIVVANADVWQDVVLLAGARKYSGVVRGLNGVALSGMMVRVYDNAGQAQITQFESKFDGSFSLSLDPGDYFFVLQGYRNWYVYNADGSYSQRSWPNGAPDTIIYSIHVSIPSNDLVRDIQIPFVELKGKTTDSKGVGAGNVALTTENYSAPILSATSHANLKEWWYIIQGYGGGSASTIYSTVSDATGNYSMWMLPPYSESGPQPYTITAVPPSGSALGSTLIGNITVTSDAVQARDFVLSQKSSYSGVVRGLSGVILPDMQVTAYDETGSVMIANSQYNPAGTFSLALSPGLYMFVVSGSSDYILTNSDGSSRHVIWPNGSPNYIKYSFHLSISSSDLIQDIQIPFAELRGKTKGSNGLDIGNVALSTENSSTAFFIPTMNAIRSEWWYVNYLINQGVSRTISDASGNYSMWVLAPYAESGPRPYIITAIPPNGSTFGSTTVTDITVTTDAVQLKDLILSKKTTYSGVVRGLNGIALPGIQVYAYDEAMQTQVAQSAQNVDGSFVLALTPGKYLIRIEGYRKWSISNLLGPSINGVWPNGAPSDILYVFPLTVASNDLIQDIQIPFVEQKGKITDRNGVGVGKVALATRNSSTYYSNGLMQGWWNIGHTNYNANPSAVSDSSGNYSMWLLVPYPEAGPSPYTITVIPPDSSGFATTPVSNINITGNKLFNAILPFTDVISPNIISGPSFRALTASSVVVEWQTDEPSTGSVKVGSVLALAPELATTHSVLVSGLAASTAYTAEVSAVDKAGNGPTVKTGSFRTAALADSIAPVILEGPSISASTDSSMVVEWITNEPAQGAVSFGLGNFSNSVTEMGYSIKHRVELAGLTSSSTYQVRVSAKDAAGNGPTISRQVVGRTLGAADTTPPVITNGPLVSDIGDSSVTVSWKTDEPSTGGVSWNDGVAYGVLSDPLLSKVHRAQITGLTGSKTYHLTVSSTDALGNGPTLSATVDFVTQASEDTTPPLILGAPTIVTITHQSAVVRWETDEPADSLVNYGTTSALGQSESRAALIAKHTVPLVGLSAGTSYQLQVSSKDAAGNSSSSAVLSFTTAGTADTTPPNFDAPPAVGFVTDKKAVVQWKTDKVTDTQVTISSFDEPPRIANDGDISDLHEVSLTGLTPGKTYSVSVSSTDMLGNTSTQALPDFTTPPAPGVVVPVVTQSPSVQANARTAIVSWSTDVLSDSKASYGPANAALTQRAGDIAYTRQHKVVLNKLQPGSTYEVQVSSSDPGGKSAVAQSRVSFTTSADNGSGNNTSTTTSTSTTSSSTTSTLGGGTTTTTTQMGAGNLALAAGWNLVGNGHETGFDVSSLFGNSAITSVWKWVAQITKWAFYAPALSTQTLTDYAASKGYDVLGRVEAGEGFWVNSKQATALSLPTGTAVTSSTFNQAGSRPLGLGWSLIAAGDSPTAATFNNALSTTPPSPGAQPLNVISLWAWDTATLGWYFWAPSLVNAGTLSSYGADKGYLDFANLPGVTTKGTLSPYSGVWVNRP